MKGPPSFVFGPPGVQNSTSVSWNAELYEDWVDETGVRIVAVSIDDQRSVNRVAPYVNSVGVEHDILLDPNRDFARALNVQNVPHTFVVDGEGNVVCRTTTTPTGTNTRTTKQR